MARYIVPHSGQGTILSSKARFRVVACGRRFGKTELGKMAIYEYLLKGKTCWWLAPTYKMASSVWRDFVAAFSRLPDATIDKPERYIVTPEGGSVAIRSTHNPDYLRGAGLDFVVLDEAAFMPPDIWTQVVRPMLLDRQGRALFLSTPQGFNWFWDVYQLGRAKPHFNPYRSFHYTSFDNPHLAPDELDAIRLVTPERIWREEYLAEFIADSGAVFREVRAAATAPTDAVPHADHVYVAGVDWGKANDATAIAIVDATTRQMVAFDRFTGIGWELQRGRLRLLCERWRPAAIWAEENSIGSPLVDALRQDGLPVRPFTTSATSKPPLIEALALAIERAELALLPDETLLSELVAYTVERLPGGGYRYSAPRGQHDDTVIATALAWHGVRVGVVSIDFF